MWMSNVLIVINRNNADRNSLADLSAAVVETGGHCLNVDAENWVIEAAVPSHEVPTIAAMDGVAYVRGVFTYLCGEMPEKAA
jgi:seryl-tRNA(Sec) selenium transferase